MWLHHPCYITPALPHEMIVMKMMKMFVLCVVTNTSPQFVGSAMRGIALNALTLTLVGMKLCMLHHNFALFLYIRDPTPPPPPCASTALSKHMSPCYRRFDGIF